MWYINRGLIDQGGLKRYFICLIFFLGGRVMRVTNYHPSQLQWVPVSDRDKDGNTGEILRMGQLVSSENIANGTAGDRWGTMGVSNHMPAAGVANTTEETRIAGVVVATNNQDRILSVLANYVGIEQITATVTQATEVARNSSQSGGHWPQNDVAMVQIVRLTPYTKVRINLYNSTRGTAPTVNTVTTGSATGAGYTADAHDHSTPVAGLATSYCRTGLNRGRMRQGTDTSSTVKTFNSQFRDDIAVGDTFVTVPLRPFGICYVQLDTESDFIDISANPATDYMHFDVHELHLEKAGEEYVIGTFGSIHFNGIRA